MAKRENYYLLLELDPDEDDWEGAIKSAIKNKRTSWSKDKSMSPSHKLKREAARNLDQLPDIEKILGSPASRRHESKHAKQLLQNQKTAALKRLQDDIKFLSVKGHVLEPEAENLVTKYKSDRINESEIRELIKVDVQTLRSNKKPDAARLDASRRIQIQEELSFLGFDDLYSFLGVPRSATIIALQSSANEIAAEAGLNANKTPQVSASQSLAGVCKAVFASEDERQKYDNTMASAGLERLDEKLRLLAGSTIRHDTIQCLVEIGTKSGVSAIIAEQHIRDWAKKHGRALEIHARRDERRACGACGSLNPKTSRRCAGCGAELHVDCPVCSTTVFNTSSHCGECGFPIGDLQVILGQLEHANQALRDGDFGEAERLTLQLGRQMPAGLSYPALETTSKQIAEQCRKTATELNEVRQLICDRQMEEAIQKLTSIRGISSEERELREQATRAISKANRLYELAVAAESKRQSESTIKYCLTALGIVSDHRASRNLIAKYPPEPVSQISASTRDSIEIHWTMSSSIGSHEYIVVRKQDQPAVTLDEGEIVGRTIAGSFVDRSAVSGIAYYYTVIVVRYGCHSNAMHVGPLVSKSEVEDLVAIPQNGAVSVSWKMPENASAITVSKCVGDKFQESSATLIKASNTGFQDTAVSNGETYTYRIVAEYREPSGTMIASTGRLLSVSPAPPSLPPSPITSLQITRTHDNMEVTWSPLARGQVSIIVGSYRPPYIPGKMILQNDLSVLGIRLKNTSAESASGTIDWEDRVFVNAVTTENGLHIFGRSVLSLPDVDELSVRRYGNQFTIQWRWPVGITTAMVAVRNDRFPINSDDTGQLTMCTRNVYDREGGFRLKLTQRQPAFAKVFVAVREAGEWQFSSGREVPQGYRTIFYQVKPKRWFGVMRTDRHRLIIRSSEASKLPELTLVAKSASVPVDPSDGSTILTLSSGTYIGSSRDLTCEFPTRLLPAKWKIRLFITEQQAGHLFEVLPEHEALQHCYRRPTV